MGVGVTVGLGVGVGTELAGANAGRRVSVRVCSKSAPVNTITGELEPTDRRMFGSISGDNFCSKSAPVNTIDGPDCPCAGDANVEILHTKNAAANNPMRILNIRE